MNPANGFPSWYEDAPGVRLAPCLDGSDTRCVLPAAGEEANFDPAQATVFPSNFPSEFFYAIADSDLVPTPGCAGTAPGRASIRFAVEGAFANTAPAVDEQITFGRVRITVNSGLCPNTAYQFVHPYGTETLTTNAAGAVAATEDIGCGATPCNFADALASRLFEGFLRWNPADGAAPAGYIGDGVTPHTVVGGRRGTSSSGSCVPMMAAWWGRRACSRSRAGWWGR